MPAQIHTASVDDLMRSITDTISLGMDDLGKLDIELTRYYAREISQMLDVVQNNPSGQLVVSLTPFSKHGSQYIANFSVSDLDLPNQNSFNWHGQNTSRWLYAGVLVYDEERNEISAHH